MILVIGGRYQGKHDFSDREFPGRPKKDLIDLYKDPGFLSALPEDTVLIAEETGSGVVPVSAADNAFREEYNRALLTAADKADRVYRVFCGIGKRLG